MDRLRFQKMVKALSSTIIRARAHVGPYLAQAAIKKFSADKAQKGHFNEGDLLQSDPILAIRSGGQVAEASDYSIWLDEETNHLLAILKRSENHMMYDLPKEAIVRKWWDYKAVEPDNTPVQVALTKIFHLK